jgi:hypothetical protein
MQTKFMYRNFCPENNLIELCSTIINAMVCLWTVFSRKLTQLSHVIQRVINGTIRLAFLFWAYLTDQCLAFKYYGKPLDLFFLRGSEVFVFTLGMLIALSEAYVAQIPSIIISGYIFGRFAMNPKRHALRWFQERQTLPLLRRIDLVLRTSKRASSLLCNRYHTTESAQSFRLLHHELLHKLPLGCPNQITSFSFYLERDYLETTCAIGWVCLDTHPSYIRDIFDAVHFCDLAMGIAPFWLCIQESLRMAFKNGEEGTILLTMDYYFQEFEYLLSQKRLLHIRCVLPIKQLPRPIMASSHLEDDDDWRSLPRSPQELLTCAQKIVRASLKDLNEIIHGGML